MTLVHRVLGTDRPPPFCVLSHKVPGLRMVALGEIVSGLCSHLYDRRSGQGHLILFNTTRTFHFGDVSLIALGATPTEALGRAEGARAIFEGLVEASPSMPG